MKDKRLSVLSDNLAWLSDNRKFDVATSAGIISDAAHLAKELYTALTPTDAIDFFTSISQNEADTSLLAIFCREIFYKGAADFLNEANVTLNDTVYMRNQLTDKAFGFFAKKHTGLRAVYSTDFRTSCEEVYYDRADSCILPFESANDGLLMSFRNMLLKYELKICEVFPIMIDDEIQTMSLVTGGAVDTSGNVCEVYIPSITSDELSRLCYAASFFNAYPERITSVRSSGNKNYDHHICFSADTSKICPLKYFLTAKYPAYILLGQYKNTYTKGMFQK